MTDQCHIYTHTHTISHFNSSINDSPSAAQICKRKLDEFVTRSANLMSTEDVTPWSSLKQPVWRIKHSGGSSKTTPVYTRKHTSTRYMIQQSLMTNIPTARNGKKNGKGIALMCLIWRHYTLELAAKFWMVDAKWSTIWATSRNMWYKIPKQLMPCTTGQKTVFSEMRVGCQIQRPSN